jgi:hypothetical protein
MKPGYPIQAHASDTKPFPNVRWFPDIDLNVDVEDAFLRAAAWDHAAAIDRETLKQLQDLETKGIPIPKKLVSTVAGVDLTVDSTEIDAEEMNSVLLPLDRADREGLPHCSVPTAVLRKLLAAYDVRQFWEVEIDRADLKGLLETWMEAAASDPAFHKIQVRNLTDQQIRVPGGKALDPYVKEDALVCRTLNKKQAQESPNVFIKAIEDGMAAATAEERLADLFDAMQWTHDVLRKPPEGGEMEQEGDVFTLEMLQEAKEKFLAAYGDAGSCPAEILKEVAKEGVLPPFLPHAPLKDDFWNLSEDFKYLTERKLEALGIPEHLISGADLDENDNWVSNRDFERTLNEISKNPNAVATLLAAAEDDRLPEEMPLRLRKLVAKFVDEQLSDENREGVMVKPRGWERGDFTTIASDTGRFSSDRPNLAASDMSEYVRDGAIVYACDSSRRVTTKASSGYVAATPLGRIVRPGETVHQGLVNEYPLAETGEMVKVLLDMGPDNYTAEKAGPTPPAWFKPAMQWFLFDTMEDGLVLVQDKHAFVIGVFNRQVQGASWEFSGVDDDGAKEMRVVLTGADFLRPARKASYERTQHDIRIRTAINYGMGWACKVTGTVTGMEDVPGDPDPDKAIVTFKLHANFRAGPVQDEHRWDDATTITGRKPSKPEMQNIPPRTSKKYHGVALDFDKLKEPLEKVSATLDEMHAYQVPPWLEQVKSRFRRRFKDDGSLDELEIHPHYRSEFFVAVDGHSDMGHRGVHVSFDRSGTSCYSQVGIRPVLRMPSQCAADREFAKILVRQMMYTQGDKEDGFAHPVVFAIVNRELDWELKCEGSWVTQMDTSADGKDTIMRLAIAHCSVIPVEEQFGGANVKRGLSRTPSLAPAPVSEPVPVVVDNSADHDLASLHRKQIDAAKAQLMGTGSTALTYIVPKADRND